MRFQDLELFVTVIEEGNFSSAARRLQLSQPAVSGRIAVLEKELATALLIREARHVVPTASGKTLYEHALKMLQGLESIKQRIQEESNEPVGPLLLSAGEVSGVYLAPLLLGTFRQQYPRVEPELRLHMVAQTLTDILEQKCSLGIVPFQPEDPRIEALPLCEDEIILIVPTGHPLADRNVVEARELLGHPLLVREREARIISALDRSLAAQGLQLNDMNITMEISSNEALKTAVAAGFGMAFISRMGLRANHPDYKVIQVAGLEMPRIFHLIRRVTETHSFADRVFWSFCASAEIQRDLRIVGLGECR